MTRNEAIEYLRGATGLSDAEFKAGQWEAIDAVANQRKRVLLVQRTGWGKSMVYFLATRILRDAGAGVTLIISPLLALMRNQLDAAERIGLRAETINSTNRDDWPRIVQTVCDGDVDILLISPERLSSESFLTDCLLPVANQIQMMVVDEAHCISDWGHDFRPDYQRIDRIIGELPANVAILATTATANDRVVADVLGQLGVSTELQRGSLARGSLALKTLNLNDRAERLAWLGKAIPSLLGSGIVYTLTQRDSERVTTWLRENGIDAHAYHGGIDGELREQLEGKILRNETKVLVATNALGMGFDKPDLGFVIHFQTPQSIVHYYQQVGRAGRAIESAVGILMGGSEDDEINGFFISQAFPPNWQVQKILTVLEASENGASVPELVRSVNLRKGQIDKVLKLLSVSNSGLVVKVGSRWFRTANPFSSDEERVQRLTAQRESEWAEMQKYLATSDCLMRFLGEALDDPHAQDCGKCENCAGEPLIEIHLSIDEIAEASRFIRRSDVVIQPRKRWEAGAFDEYGWSGNIPLELQNQEGRCLAIWRDAGWGEQVELEKQAGNFSDELVEACAEMIENRWGPNPAPEWVSCVPSLRSTVLVPQFANRLADRLGIPFVEAVVKLKETERQRNMMNGWQQSRNLDGAFAVDSNLVKSGPMLLVDDVVDSRWSLTVIGALLLQCGSGPVSPLALASASSASG